MRIKSWREKRTEKWCNEYSEQYSLAQDDVWRKRFSLLNEDEKEEGAFGYEASIASDDECTESKRSWKVCPYLVQVIEDAIGQSGCFIWVHLCVI